MQSSPENRRRDARLPLLTHVQLSLGGVVLGMARTHDLSASGFAGTTRVPLELGQSIGIGINGVGTVDATVVRQELRRFAARFAKPIDLDDVDVSPIVAPHEVMPRRSAREEGTWT
ncbi:MAG: PilZ domain-containing protein [Parasphingopyxis sp.]|uniref:PilZ domain-containing protein n=1 Tax=Parasphingopyxis sp. TaxID=1920299 RepID=UPI003F9F2082